MTNPKARLLTDEVVRKAVAIMRRTITPYPCAGCEQAELSSRTPKTSACMSLPDETQTHSHTLLQTAWVNAYAYKELRTALACEVNDDPTNSKREPTAEHDDHCSAVLSCIHQASTSLGSAFSVLFAVYLDFVPHFSFPTPALPPFLSATTW